MGLRDMAQHYSSSDMLNMQTQNQATQVNNSLRLQVLERRGMLEFYMIWIGYSILIYVTYDHEKKYILHKLHDQMINKVQHNGYTKL